MHRRNMKYANYIWKNHSVIITLYKELPVKNKTAVIKRYINDKEKEDGT